MIYIKKSTFLSFKKSAITTLVLLFIIAACSRQEPITENNFEEVEFAPFVEEEFPFITTSLVVSFDNEWILENNVVPRCLALILGEESYACFDTDMLRWAAAWRGDFVPMETMAQVSYSDFFSRNSRLPDLPSQPDIITGMYPGWSGPDPQFEDPRQPAPHPDEPSSGPLPPELGRWNGVYLTDDGPVLSYSVYGTDITETPGSIESDGETVFTRTFRIGSRETGLSLAAGEVVDALRSEVSAVRAVIYHGQTEQKVSVFKLSGGNDAVTLEVTDNRYATVHLPAGEEPLEFTLLIWNGDTGQASNVEQMADGASFSTPLYRDGATNLWPDEVRTRGKLSADTSAFVVDELTLPVPNPWNRNVRVVDVAFFEDGRAALVTFEGDVWIVDGIDDDLHSMRWNRFASGLFETQSIEIVNGQIYTYGKDGIVRLHDLNGNGAADFYENFSNLMAQSIETREWASDMVAKPGGGFYVAKGGALDMGPRGLTEAVARGFRAGSHHTGVILEISEDGRSAELFASGFRGPYLGINPETGLLTASDQEGHQVPSTPVLAVNRGDYFGVEATAHRDPVPEITSPLLWIPHSVDRSGISQAWITGDRMGPISGDMIHFSYGRPGLFRILIDSTGAGAQGGIAFLPANYPAPTMKGAVNPSDGQLYATGFAIWDTNSEGLTAFIRLRYTGLPGYMPDSFSVRDGGVVLRFDEELDEDSVKEISNYRVERWNYLRTEEYGSGHYKLDGTPGQELLPVFSAHLSDDKKGVYLAIPNIEQVDQMQVSYRFYAADGTEIDDVFWFTVNHVETIDLVTEGFSGLDGEDLFTGVGEWEGMEEVEIPVTAERGEELFLRSGCMGCHTVDGSEGGERRGPTIKGLFGSERRFQDGSALIADEDYIRHKLKNPGESIAEGYEEGMPSFLGILSDDDIDSIILYIKSLSE